MTALAIPDPRQQPVPLGWAESEAAPAILSEGSWETLDEYEARLRAMVSYVESFSGDALEFEKALRVVEKRRGDLLGPAQVGRPPGNLPRMESIEASPQTMSRWRTIAEHWDDLWPLIRDATRKSEVTQAAVLRVIGDGLPESVPAVVMPGHLQKLAEYVSIMARVQGLLNQAYDVMQQAVSEGATLDEIVEVGGVPRDEAERFLGQRSAA